MDTTSNNKKSLKTDPAWKHGKQVAGPILNGKAAVYVLCKYCDTVVKGGISRFKSHLAHTHKGVAACPSVPAEVKQETLDQLRKGETARAIRKQNFEFLVNEGSNSHAPMKNTEMAFGPLNATAGDRGIRGPMDRFLNSMVQETGGHQRITPHNGINHRKNVCLDIGRFFFENGISFNVARSPSFANMLRSIGEYGRGLKQPSMYELSTWILKEEVNSTNKMVDNLKRTWENTGVTIMSDGWTDIRKRHLINFLVNNPEGTVFLKSIDASKYVKDANRLFKMLDAIVEEVGEEHVMQVVTDNAAAYKAAGNLLMRKRKKLYWTPCAAHCIDLMLERLFDLPQMKNAYLKAKKVANYIYSHGYVLAMMRSFTRRELIRPGDTRFATANLTLQSLLQNKESLEEMFSYNRWNNCDWSNKTDAKEVKKIIMRDPTFWTGLVYFLKATKPLVGVLRLVDSENVPAMGFIYGAMDRAKEVIAANFDGDVSKYKEIWDIIDEKWDFQMHRDLHDAGYFLNPQFQYEDNFSNHPEIRHGLYNCMEKLLPRDDLATAHVELDKYCNKEGCFGRLEAETTRKLKTPARWWQSYGMDVPILQGLAIRILSLTCSASGCERNWSTFNQVHTKRRNRLETAKLNALVFIMYNKRLRLKCLQKRVKMQKKDEDILVADEIPSDDEWLFDDPQEPENENIDDDWEHEDDINVTEEVQTTWQRDLEELHFESLDIDSATQNDEPDASDLPTQQRRRERDSTGRGRGEHNKRGRGTTSTCQTRGRCSTSHTRERGTTSLTRGRDNEWFEEEEDLSMLHDDYLQDDINDADIRG